MPMPTLGNFALPAGSRNAVLLRDLEVLASDRFRAGMPKSF